MDSEAAAVALPLETVRRTGCPQAAEPLVVIITVPWACWPAESAACVQVAPPPVGWQLQPLPPKELPLNSEAPAGRSIAAVSEPDAVEPELVTWNVTWSGCPDAP